MNRVLTSAVFLVLVMGSFAQQKNKKSKAGREMNHMEVRVEQGRLAGINDLPGVVAFKGIPYAAAPIGPLRWRSPQPAPAWSGVKEANRFGPRAMQTGIFGDMNFRSNGMGEDCLYLNVWAPAKKSAGLPVLVYFYGGGFVAGDGSEPRYDGGSMASKGIVAVTVNYRLGVFGFMAHPELTAESEHHASGNYALQDQAAALQWVKQNISAFGGDPAKITIAGESAGSVSVSAQMASPLARNVLAGAIGESGSLLGTLGAVPLSKAEQNGVEFATSVGAQSLADLRKIPAEKLLQESAKFGLFKFSMNVDGYVFPKSPYEIFEGGEQAHVPLLVGWNSEEMNYRAIMGNQELTKDNYVKTVQKLYGDKADDILKAYAVQSDAEVEEVATNLAGDRFIGFSTWKWSDVHAQTSGKPVFRYLYERPRPAMVPSMGNASPGLAGGVVKNAGATKTPAAKGAVHSAEIEYAMGNLSTNKVYQWSSDDFKVSALMQAYFANFIKKGDPNGPGLPEWPAVNSRTDAPVMRINVKPALEPARHAERYKLLDQMATEQRKKPS